MMETEKQPAERRHTHRRMEDEVIPWQRVWERAKWWMVFATAGGAAVTGIGMAVVGTTTWFLKLDNRVNENTKHIGEVSGVLAKSIEQLRECREYNARTAVLLDSLTKAIDRLNDKVEKR